MPASSTFAVRGPRLHPTRLAVGIVINIAGMALAASHFAAPVILAAH